MLIELIFGSAFLSLFAITEVGTFDKLKLPAFMTTLFMGISFLITQSVSYGILALFTGLLLADVKIFRNWSEVKIIVGIGFLLHNTIAFVFCLVMAQLIQLFLLKFDQNLKITPLALAFMLISILLFFI